MRMLVVLLALLIVGLMVARQLGGSAPAHVGKPATVPDGTVPDVPAMPVKPQEVREFERRVEGYVNDLATERAKQMEQAESGK